MCNYKTITFEQRDKIGIIKFNRHEKLNTINPLMKEELLYLFDKISQDESIWVVLVYGSETIFGAGADVTETSLEATGKTQNICTFDGVKSLQRLCDRIEQLEKPVIAAMAGYCLGGSLEIALACDIRIGSDNLKAGLPELKLGALPGAGGTQRLPRIIGASKAKDLLFTSRMVDGKEALSLGLIDYLYEEGTLYENAIRYAEIVAEKSPLTTALVKQLIRSAEEQPLKKGLDEEAWGAVMLYGTEDQKEAGRAFLEKRKPNFKGC